MSDPRRSRRWPRALRGLASVALLLALLSGAGILTPQAAQAHPIDEYLQATYITVAPDDIALELDLTPGVLVAPQLLPAIDTDGNEQISDAEGQAYADTVLRDLLLQVDGERLILSPTRVDVPTYLNLQAGYGTFRVFANAALPDSMTDTHQILYSNGYAPPGATYQVNAFVDKGDAITLGKQNRDRTQRSMTVDYAIGNASPGADVSLATAPADDAPAGVAGQAQPLLAYLDAPDMSPWRLLLALGLAVVLGGLHAMTPGHGKTLVAAYLVGSRGTVRHAVALGAIVTVTHTAAVIVIGLLALVASQFIVPDVLVPALEIVAGALVVGLGLRLVWQRWGAMRQGDDAHAHAHNHDHDHDHTHNHGEGHTHTHLPPAGRLSFGSLVAMGMAGGLVPCPEALGIMVIAIGLNRVLLGLGLIVSFSLGLAAALMILGILLVRSRSLVERFGGLSGRWSSRLQLGSAIIVTVLGLAMTFGGLQTVVN